MKSNILGTILVSIGLSIGFVSPAFAAFNIMPTSYDMLNGESGRFNYWDLNYTGSGNTNISLDPLSGGLGDLTDGVIATDNWVYTENSAGSGPYVGWNSIDPTITFNFDEVVNIDSVTIWVDDSNDLGRVSTPGSVEIRMGGATLNFNITDPPGSEPISVTFPNLGLSGTSLELQLFDGIAPWVFISEVAFEGTVAAVPEPFTLLGSLTALGFGAFLKKKLSAKTQ